jgi:hypothetical protein
MAQTGYFLIADISGYTAFLTQAELEHAQDILENLFHALLDNIKPPLVVSKLEGDAIFCYAPDGSFLRGQTLLETIENIYHVFSSTRERMHRNTTCTCTACTLIPTLDLKFVLHHGEYVISNMGVQKELQGSDVIVVHRLLKNSVDETFKTKSYAFLSQTAATAMKIEEICHSEMKPHKEEYEHIGEVAGFVHDLKAVMDRQRDERRFVIPIEKAWKKHESTFPVSPALLWDYLNDPARQKEWMHVHKIWLDNNGRKERGSVMHCAHGKNAESRFMIEDWQPFEYWTMSLMFGIGKFIQGTHLIPEGSGTRLVWTFDSETKGPVQTLMMKLFFNFMIEKDYRESMRRLHEMIDADLQAGRVIPQVQPELASVPG